MAQSQRIKQLPRQVYDLIAAGEVVTSPLSAAKELVENAVDAGASRIWAEIEEGGIALIRVSDDGTGIDPKDLPLAFAPHATSKINDADDLGRIATLGFRGEALASIAAVAEVEMVTKTAGSESAAGSRIQIRGGEALKIEKIGADMGTTVTVSDLFFNIPARLKHLNAPRSEGAKIVDYLSRMAISYPNIAFRLISNGTVLFATRGAGDRLAAITTVYGTGVAAFLIGVTGVDSDLGMSLEGYIAGPNGLRKSRKGQVLFVNGRSVKNPAIDAAIDRAYKEFAEPGRFPFTFLFLKVNPADVDVNVHPAKNEIAFADAAMAGEFVEKTIRAVLVSERSVPTLSLRGRGRRRAGADDTFRLQPDANPQTAPSAVSADGSAYGPADGPAYGPDGSADGPDGLESGPEAAERPYDMKVGDAETLLVSTSGGNGARIESVDVNSFWSTNSAGISKLPAISHSEIAVVEEAHSVYGNNLLLNNTEKRAFGGAHRDETIPPYETGYESEYESDDPGLNIASLNVLTALFATYLLAADADHVYLIDQHAAHERIHYERFLKAWREREILTQTLLSPYLFTVPASAAVSDGFGEEIAFLGKFGYEVDEFGDKTFAARTFPAFLSYEEGQAFLTELLSEIGEQGTGAEKNSAGAEGRFENAAAVGRIIMRACKSSIKANRTLTGAETGALLKDLAACANPYTCPHGRPVILKLTKSEIEHMFKRA